MLKAATGKVAELGVPLTLRPMEARAAADLPAGASWQYEPKWDGFRCLAFRSGSEVEIRAKSGKSLSHFFPEMLQQLRALAARHFVLDGELTIASNGAVCFEALQARLHPAASRIRQLAAATPATFIAFDCLLCAPGKPLLSQPFARRRATLDRVFAPASSKASGLALTPFTRDLAEARRWLHRRHTSLDGVLAKRLDLPYQPGVRGMLKVKCLRTADCVVGGFRYETGSRLVGSLLLGLYDEAGLLNHVGFTSSIAAEAKVELTRRLEKLVAAPGFTGAAPGGPSRWSTPRASQWQPLRPRLVVEVRYDLLSDQRFRHGTKLVRWRPDKSPRQCTFEQLAQPTALASAPPLDILPA
jgi:ATP-dependent DNA ligase